MADPNYPSNPVNHPSQEASPVEENASPPVSPDDGRRGRRPVYEPTLLPPRKRRRMSPWVVIPGLLIFLGVLLYLLLIAPRQRHFVATANRIVFASDQGTPGHSHLWVAHRDGSGAKRLTNKEVDETSPAWSPDGSQIVFLATPAGGQPQVWAVDADGQNLTQVTRNAGAKAQPAFAPSDTALVGYTSGGALSTANLLTTDTTRLLPAASDASQPQNADVLGSAQSPITIVSYAWMPVHERAQQGLAAVEDNNGVQALVLLPTLTEKPRDTHTGQPTDSPLAAADTLSLGWSPDGGLLAVGLLGIKGLPPGRHASGLLLLDSQANPVSQQPLPLIADESTGPQNPVFSPDGTQIAFELWQGADLAHRHSVGLFLIPVGGNAAPRPLYRGEAEKVRFSADGRSVFFLTKRSDSGHDLCRVSLDGTGFVRLSDGKADVSALEVSPQQPPRP